MLSLSLWRRVAAAGALCLALFTSPAFPSSPPVAASTGPVPLMLGEQNGPLRLAGRSQQYVDLDGRLSIDEVEARGEDLPWQTHLADTRFTLEQGAALWLRFDVLHSTDAHGELELARSGTDLVSLYHRDAQGRWRVQHAGDRLPVRDWAHPDRYPVFGLDSRADTPVRYWVRVEHARVPFSGVFQLHSHHGLLEERIQQQFALGAYFGMALLLTAVALVNMTVFRDAAFALYAVYIGLLCLGLAASLGVGGQFLWPGSVRWNQSAEFLLVPLAGAAALLFIRQVAQPRRLGRTLDRACLILLPPWLAAIAWDQLWPSRLSLQVLTGISVAAMVLVAAMLWRSWRSGESWLRWFALGMLPMLVASALPVMRNFNLISSGFLSQYGMVIAAALEAPMLIYALLLRSQLQHEAQVRARALERTEPLTGLMPSHHFLLNLHHSLVRSQRYGHQSALLLVHLDNHGEIARRHGREIADRALVIAASQLRQTARDVDTAARVDDDSFALLMEGPVRAQHAINTATSLVANGLRPSPRLPAATTLRLRVVVALLPDAKSPVKGQGTDETAQDASACLEWLHEGMRTLAEDPRKAILRLNF